MDKTIKREIGYLKKLSSNRIRKMILQWNVESRRRKGKLREQWMNGVILCMISRDLMQEEREFLKSENLF